ncbi:MAG: polymer-forming cytoskeletal protein [Verrucomicrobia bacterium]|nr:polymer-forming cytoskeletal protein [Verrucomicrobiota bacterium]
MFKFAKGFLDKNINEESSVAVEEVYEVPPPPLEIEEPETIIGENVSLKGTLSFQKMIQIDGTFEGEIESQGKIIIGPHGYVKAHLNLQEAFIAGKVEGDITVKERLVLRGRAEVRGNITAPLISVDEGVSIIGQVYVTAPDSISE